MAVSRLGLENVVGNSFLFLSVFGVCSYSFLLFLARYDDLPFFIKLRYS